MVQAPTCVTGAAPDVRPTTEADRSDIARIHREAFSQDEEADLALALLDDPSAAPRISLLAAIDGMAVGHVLSSHALIAQNDGEGIAASLIAPLGIVGHAQRRGCGGQLVVSAVNAAKAAGAQFVFVFGDPAYYGRLGFKSAVPFRVQPPHPVGAHEDAFMVHVTSGSALPPAGKLACAQSLDHPALWAA
ncbi:MAG: N-acetyltransferase [Pseudomonadota bacterium]